MTPPFTLALAKDAHWGRAAKACLEGIAGADADVGFLYATGPLAEDLSSILTFLRETTHIPTWVGGAVSGLCANDAEIRDEGALAVMAGSLPPGSFRTFAARDGDGFRAQAGAWAAANRPCVGLVHGDPRDAALADLVASVAGEAGFLAGGLVSAGSAEAQVAGTMVGGGLSGLLLSPRVPVVVGMTQGCTPLGAVHEVTEAWEGVVIALDDRPALEVLKEEAGELIARNPRRAAGYIHVGLPVRGSDSGDYVVRGLLGIDPAKGWLAVGERMAPGDRLLFVRKDANAAQEDLRRMAADVARRLEGRPARAAFYFTCVARGRHMFGEDGAELAAIRRALGPDVPLAGFFANGEIAGERLYGYTGVLAVIAGGEPA